MLLLVSRQTLSLTYRAPKNVIGSGENASLSQNDSFSFGNKPLQVARLASEGSDLVECFLRSHISD